MSAACDCCENCRFVRTLGGTEAAWCHRYAPAVGARSWYTDGKPVWPNVALYDWCGEFEAAASAPLPEDTNE